MFYTSIFSEVFQQLYLFVVQQYIPVVKGVCEELFGNDVFAGVQLMNIIAE